MRTATACVIASSLALPASLSAQPVIGQPASALIFPAIQSGAGRATLVTVTNTSRDVSVCSSGFRRGDVVLHYRYRFVVGVECRTVDRSQALTPGDTLTILTGLDAPQVTLGWLWVEARDPESNQAIDFDFLVGSAILVDNSASFTMRYLPVGFRALPPNSVALGCGHFATDLDADAEADFDGNEYDYWPLHLYLDEFLQEAGSVTSELFVASSDQSTRDASPTTLHFIFVNNRENAFSRFFNMDCFARFALTDVSAVPSVLNGDPNELRTAGGQSVQTGWLDLTGSDPVLGLFLQHIGSGSRAEGTILQVAGAYGSPDDPDSTHVPASLVRG